MGELVDCLMSIRESRDERNNKNDTGKEEEKKQ